MTQKDFIQQINILVKEYELEGYEKVLAYVKSHKKTVDQRKRYSTSDSAKKAAKLRRERDKRMKDEYNKLQKDEEFKKFISRKEKKGQNKKAA